MEENPIDKAHKHANMAEEYESKGMFREAAHEHSIAADAEVRTSTPTYLEGLLNLLSSAHGRHGFELERRLIRSISQASDGNSSMKGTSRHGIATSRHSPSVVKFKSGMRDFDVNSKAQENAFGPFDRFWRAIEELVQNSSAYGLIPPENLENLRIEDDQERYIAGGEDNAETKGMLGSFILVPDQFTEIENMNDSSIPIPNSYPENAHATEPSNQFKDQSAMTMEEYIVENQRLK
ncbi:hypothetical protein K493DRAFT_333303, partial [Basidiobolus meristosporus CBS 931.73]